MSDFDARITEAEKRAKELAEMLEEYRPKFLSQVLADTKPWIAERVQRGATVDFPSKTKELGKTVITQIKAEISRVQDKSASEVQIALKDKKLWPHLREMPKETEPMTAKPDDYEILREFNDSVSQLIKLQYGRAGEILKKFGFIEYQDYGEWASNGNYVFYRFGITLSSAMKMLLDDYGKLFSELFNKVIELNGLRLRKERQEAEEIWKIS